MKSIALLAAAASMLLAQKPLASTMLAQKPLIEGNPASAVRVIIYEDLQCPDCANFRAEMDKVLLPRFATTVAFEHRDFPLAKHPWARKASIAARFFASVTPEIGIEFRRETMAHLREIKPEVFNDHVAKFARAHNIDAIKAVAALDDVANAAAVEADFQDGTARGVAHTPTVLIDGEAFVERFSIEDVIKSIEQALKAITK